MCRKAAQDLWVGGVERHVDGQVADYLYAQGVDVVPQLVPLLVERVLYPGEEPHVRVQQRPVVLKAPRLSEPHVLVRPERPGHHAEMPLERHKEGVVRQPAGVLLPEACYLRGIPVPAARAGQAQDVEAVAVDLAVVHVHGVRAPVHGLDLGLFEQPVLDEQVEVDEIGVAREGGEGGVGRVAVARGAEGQELPGLLSRRGQEVREFIGLLAEGAYAVVRRQGGYGHEYAAFTLHNCLPLHGAGDDAFDNVFLPRKIDYDDGEDGEHDAGHHGAHLDPAVAAAEVLDEHGDGLVLVYVQD